MSVSSIPFWRVVPGDQQDRFVLPVMKPATVGHDGAHHIMGGVAMAAMIDAMELDSGLPLLWAQVQFLSPTHHAEELDVTCQQCGGGRAIAQYLGNASVNARPTHRMNAALGAREPSEQQVFAEMPDVPGPDGCTKDTARFSEPGGLADQFERRVALEDSDKGRQAIWTRSTAGFSVDAGWLAIISDLFLGCHPATRGGSSLDSTMRYIQGADPGWILSQIEFAAFDRGVVHGSARHFSEDGRLLAISSQTGVLPRIPLGGGDA